MLEFFRTYQRYFFFVVTIVVITSFTFFGTYSTFSSQGVEENNRVVGHAIDGSDIRLSDVQKLSRFLYADREDMMQGRGVYPNFCNDGVIRHDLIESGLADLLVRQYFDVLKADLAVRLDKAKRFRPYVHPDAPSISAQTIWDRLTPQMGVELKALQAAKEPSVETFSHLSQLYQLQSRLHPEMLRRVLFYQIQQHPWLSSDRLAHEDLALFGFHSITDWFGRHFVDLVSELILNAAAKAEEKGYFVSVEEAKGDLIRHFADTMEKMVDPKDTPELKFSQHLKVLGFDENSAAEIWRKVLLFRAYFNDIGASAFVDRLSYQDFAQYAAETAVVQQFSWPIRLSSARDLAEFEFYVKSISAQSEKGLPTELLSIAEIEKKVPQLVQTTYRAQVAQVAKSELALRPTLKEVWQWETSDAHWDHLRKEFSLPELAAPQMRFQALERLDPKVRSQVDAFARLQLVDENPSWIEEALTAAPMKEKTWVVTGRDAPDLKEANVYFRVEGMQPLDEKHILSFDKARSILSRLVPAVEGDCPKEKNPFFGKSKEVLAALQKDRASLRWVQTGANPILDQFKLIKAEKTVPRTAQESWMKEQAFNMASDLWSPIHVAENGEILFFYMQEKTASPVSSILEQVNFGKEILAMDAKRFAMEKLLLDIKEKQAIVIPVQQEGEE